MTPVEFVCSACHGRERAAPGVWRCRRCGGVFDLVERRPFRVASIDPARQGLWRYGAMLGVPEGAPPVTLGEGMTPLIEVPFAGRPVHFKLEYLAPTGSFKDRGTSVLVTTLRAWGVSRAADDSSGNAGASFAAYAARAGIAAEIYAPADASPAKLAQIGVFGAALHLIEGPREQATEALEAAVPRGLVYASHAWLPFTLEGTRTIAYEIWEQMSERFIGASGRGTGVPAPDVFVCPVGQGSLLLGAYRGFRDLRDAGLIDRLPSIVGVQSAGCCPLAAAFAEGLDHAAAVERHASVAEGIMTARPLRDREVLDAIRDTGGRIVAVTDEQTIRARTALARGGFFVEPTSAVVAAALQALDLPGVVVAALTGSGLKSAV